MITTNINPIDELGALQAQIKELTKQAEAIKDSIKEEASMTGQRVWEGDAYQALYVETNRSNIDWAGIAKELSIPAELIAKYTKTSAVYSVKCDPKKVK